MMKCSGEAEQMSLYEYEERLYHWNEAHRSSDDVGPPDIDTTMKLIEMASADKRLTGPRVSLQPK